ncbi:hypothetical protein PF004_g21338 [Phytophthora fragariae]|uniref:Uncharacterized protein n=1 Tax=Phytophthora fragariae TaxID=53985 RepID=A0A6G0N3Y4_9STRA|nr:hypothetical protein PF004_g21338 [Phytophthora fragariae]
MAKPAVSDSAEPAHVGDSAATGSASSTPPASGAAGSVAAADTPAAVDASEPSPRDDSRGQVGSASARPLLAPVPCHPWVWAPVIGIASGPRFPDEPLFESALELEEFFRAQSPTPPPSPDAPSRDKDLDRLMGHLKERDVAYTALQGVSSSYFPQIQEAAQVVSSGGPDRALRFANFTSSADYSTFRASLDYFGCSGYNFVCIWRCGVGWISEPSWRPASLVSTNSSGGSAGASSATDINNPPISSPAPPARATPNPAPSPAAFASVVSTAFTKKKKKKKKKKASKPATSATAEPASSSRSVKSSQPGAKSTQSAGTKKSISPRTTGKRMAAQNARVLQALEIQTLEASDDAVLGNADGVSSTSADNPVVVGSSSASSESDQAEESASSAFHSAASSVDSDSESGDSADRSGQHLKDAKALEALRTWSTKMKDANVAYDNDDEEEEDEELENKPARPAGAVDSASAAPAASPSSRGAAKRAHHSSPSRHPRKPGRLQRLRKVNLRLSSQLRPSRLRTSQRPPSRLRLSQPSRFQRRPASRLATPSALISLTY